jgi:CubicO group peptidase (beta-lactamase class C family)
LARRRNQYLDGSKQGFANYTLSLPERKGHQPGEQFYYSSGDTNVLMVVLKSALGPRYDAYPREQFFEPLGIKDATFEQDSTGIFVGPSYLYLKLCDFARNGQLFASKGWINGKDGPHRLIPESYWKRMNPVAPAVDDLAPGADHSKKSEPLNPPAQLRRTIRVIT